MYFLSKIEKYIYFQGKNPRMTLLSPTIIDIPKMEVFRIFFDKNFIFTFFVSRPTVFWDRWSRVLTYRLQPFFSETVTFYFYFYFFLELCS